MTYYRVSEAAALLNISASSLRRYVREGRVECSWNPGGQRVFLLKDLEAFHGGPLIGEREASASAELVFYVRASDGDAAALQSQETALRSAYGEPKKVFRDRASGLNEKRPGLKSLLAAAKKGQFKRVAVTQEDRLTRFGFTYLVELLEAYGVEVVTLGQKDKVTIHEELMGDFMNLITSFSGRYYRLRGRDQARAFLEEAGKRLEKEE